MPAGRPREFDIDQALDQALQVFWRKGFDGASLPDLTRAMGINRPSLYAAFGNKEALFRKAIDRYVAGSAAYLHAALQEPTARAAVERLLHGNIDLITAGPRGCFLVQGAQACGATADPLRREMARRRSAVEAALRALRAGDRRGRPAEQHRCGRSGALCDNDIVWPGGPGCGRCHSRRTPPCSGPGTAGVANVNTTQELARIESPETSVNWCGHKAKNPANSCFRNHWRDSCL